MVDIPSGVNVPGADKATIDIASKLKAFPKVSCGWGSKPVYIVAIAKPKNTLLPLYVPVSEATIEGRVLSVGFIEVKKLTTLANLDGITSACVPILPTVWYEFRAKKYNVDFGNGMAQFSNWKSVTNVVVFEGKIDIPSVSGTFPIKVSFSDLKTEVWSESPISINVPGYKTITPVGMPFKIYINNVEIESGTMTGGQLIVYSTKRLTTIADLFATLGKPAEVKAVIKFDTSEWVGKRTVTLPTACIPPQVWNPITGKCEAPIPIVPPIVPPIAPPGCAQVATTIDSINHPAEITNFLAPFYVYLRGIKEICKADPTNPAFISKLPKGTMGTITLGSLSSNFYLTDDGIADIDLSKLINLPSLAGVAVGVTPPPVVIPVDTECSTKSGRIGSPGVYLVSLSAVQSYLNKCHPGGIAEMVTGTWAGAFKITRSTGGKYPAGTYFWTTTWEDIRRLY